MKKLALVLIALASFGSAASAATITNTSYKTAQAAARAGAKAAFIKAQPWKRSAGSVRITKALDTRGNSQKYQVSGLGQRKVVTVVKTGNVWRAYTPNRNVFTPANAYQK